MDTERVEHWVARGAQMTDRVAKLVVEAREQPSPAPEGGAPDASEPAAPASEAAAAEGAESEGASGEGEAVEEEVSGASAEPAPESRESR